MILTCLYPFQLGSLFIIKFKVWWVVPSISVRDVLIFSSSAKGQLFLTFAHYRDLKQKKERWRIFA